MAERNRQFLFRRFRDLRQDDLDCELHMHTSRTDGRGAISELLEECRRKGLRSVAFTEHVRRSTDWFASFAMEVRAEAERFPDLQVGVGCEAKTLDDDGTLDVSPEILRECDIVLGSVHRFPDRQGGVVEPGQFPAREMAERECELSLGLLQSPQIDVLAHPGSMHARKFGDYPEDLFRRILTASLERGIAVEINSRYLKDLGPFLRLCEEINPWVSIGSDVHDSSEIGTCRDLLRSRGVGRC